MGTVNMEREQGMEGWRRNLGRNGELALQGRRFEKWEDVCAAVEAATAY